MRASLFACACRQSFDHPGAVVCDRLRVNTCALAWVVAAVKHYKANTTLKYLYLENKVENEGAAALAFFGIARAWFRQMLLRNDALRAGVSELLYEGTRSTDHFA